MGEAKRRGTFDERRALSPGMQHQVLLVAENGSEREPLAVVQELIDPVTGRPVQRPFRGSLEDAESLAKDLRIVNPRGVYEVKGPEKLRHVLGVNRAKREGAYRAPPAIKPGRMPRLRRISQHKEIVSAMRLSPFDAIGNQGRRIKQAKEQGRLDGLTVGDLKKLTRMEHIQLKEPRPHRIWLALWKYRRDRTPIAPMAGAPTAAPTPPRHIPRCHKLPTPTSRPGACARRVAKHWQRILRAARAAAKAKAEADQ